MKKRLLLGFTLLALFGAVKAQGNIQKDVDYRDFQDYSSCTNYCLTDGHEHSFALCNNICAPLVEKK